MKKAIFLVIIITTLFNTYIVYGQPVVVSTMSPNNFTQSTVTLNGMYSNNVANDTMTTWFEYGLTPGALSSSTTPQVFTSASAPFSFNVAGLYCDSTYYFKAVAKHTAGFVYGIVSVFTMIPCTVTGVESIDVKPKITIAPNPVKNISYITISPATQSGEVYIYNMIGNLVKTIPIIDGVSEIHKEDFSSGMYIYQTIIKGKSYTGKMSVQ